MHFLTNSQKVFWETGSVVISDFTRAFPPLPGMRTVTRAAAKARLSKGNVQNNNESREVGVLHPSPRSCELWQH